MTLKSAKTDLVRIIASMNCYNWKYNLFAILLAISPSAITCALDSYFREYYLPLYMAHYGAFLVTSCLCGCFCWTPSFLTVKLDTCEHLLIDGNGRIILSSDTESENVETIELGSLAVNSEENEKMTGNGNVALESLAEEDELSSCVELGNNSGRRLIEPLYEA